MSGQANLQPNGAVGAGHQIWSKLGYKGFVSVSHYSASLEIWIQQGWASMQIIVLKMNKVLIMILV